MPGYVWVFTLPPLPLPSPRQKLDEFVVTRPLLGLNHYYYYYYYYYYWKRMMMRKKEVEVTKSTEQGVK